MLTRIPVLDLNAQGDQVKAVQANLVKVGGAVPPTESAAGTLGSGTADAVKQFQIQAKLPVTGTVDVVTQTTLNNAAAVAGTNQSDVSGRMFYGLAANWTSGKQHYRATVLGRLWRCSDEAGRGQDGHENGVQRVGCHRWISRMA